MTSSSPNGTTAEAVATTSDTAVTVISSIDRDEADLHILNTSSVAGFFSIDGGTTWGYLPAGPCDIKLSGVPSSASVKVKRIASGSNLTGIYAWTQ